MPFFSVQSEGVDRLIKKFEVLKTQKSDFCSSFLLISNSFLQYYLVRPRDRKSAADVDLPTTQFYLIGIVWSWPWPMGMERWDMMMMRAMRGMISPYPFPGSWAPRLLARRSLSECWPLSTKDIYWQRRFSVSPKYVCSLLQNVRIFVYVCLC